MPTSHAPLDRSAFSLSRCPKIRSRRTGADRAIDYQSQRFEEIARDVDLVLDLVGGQTQERSWSVLKRGGILVSALGEPSREQAMQHRAHGLGYRAQPNAGQLAEIGRLIDQGKVRPVVCAVTRRRFPVGASPTRRFAPAGSNRSRHGGDEMSEAFG